MVKDMWENLKKILAPYTFEDYIRESDPKLPQDVEKLEREYFRAKEAIPSKYY
jgi:hypothetical protein